MKRALLLLVLLSTATAAADLPVRKQEYLSPVYTIDKIYRSMEGPGTVQKIYIGDPNKPELMWIVGVKTEMVGEDGTTPALPEFMCHVNVDLDPQKHQALFKLKRWTATRLITLSQGVVDTRVPDGFGFPIASNEPLTLFTQVLNHNIADPKNMKVRHRVTFEYIRDAELTQPLKPLYNVGASGTVLLADELALPSMPTASTSAVEASSSSTNAHGASCLLAPRAPNAASGGASDYVDPQGRKLTGHWVVPPGKQVNHSDISWFMGLPYDSVLHFAAIHLHPFAKSLIIRDVTADKTIFEAKARGPEKGVGLDHVDTFKSARGVPFYKNHKYELISVYDNPTQENADSMASVFLGFADPEFVKPDPATLAARAAAFLDEARDLSIAIRTSAGDFGVSLLRDESPNTSKQFVRLARVGAYDKARIVRADSGSIRIALGSPLTEMQRSVIQPIPGETKARHTSGTLTLCPGDQAFTVVLDNMSAFDGRCTPFARIGPGAATLRAILEAPPGAAIELRKIDIFEGADAVGLELAPAKAVTTASTQ